MDGDRAHRIVDPLPVEVVHGFDGQHGGDETDDDGCPGRDECARRRDGDEAGEHAVHHHAGIGLAGLQLDVDHAHDGTDGAGDGGVGGDRGELDIGRREGGGGVEAEPPEQEDEAAELCHRDVVTGDGSRLAVRAVLADARSEHDCTGEGGDATHGVHDARAGEVDVTGTEAHGVPRLREPTAAPRPRREDRVVDGAAEQAPHHEAVPLPPLGHRPGGDRGDGVHERHHVEEEAQQRRRRSATQVVVTPPQEGPVAGTQERLAHRRAAGSEVDARVEAAEGEREPDEQEADEAEPEDGEVGTHHVRRVLLLGEAGLDEREAGLHEDHEDGTDDHPQQVHLLGERGDGIDLLGERRAGDDQGGHRGAGEAADHVFECGKLAH